MRSRMRAYIERYAALLDQKAVGLTGTVFVHIALRREEQRELAAFEEAVREVPEIMECYLMTGEFDYLLRVVVRDMADFERSAQRVVDTTAGRCTCELERRDSDCHEVDGITAELVAV